MSMRSLFLPAVLSLALILAVAPGGHAQDPAAKPRPVQQAPRQPGDEAQKPEPQPMPDAASEDLRRAIANLADQVAVLSKEVKRLRQETERSSFTLELLLYEERLARAEGRIEDAMANKSQLDAREQEIVRRRSNIQQELAFRGILRREEAETALRAELQRQLEDIRSQQAAAQQHILDLQLQAQRLRLRIEEIRKKIEKQEAKAESQQ